MNWNEYKRTPERLLKGRKAKLVASVQSRVAKLPKGAIVTIIGKRNGLDIESAPCPHCGVSVFMRKVLPTDVELLRSDSNTAFSDQAVSPEETLRPDDRLTLYVEAFGNLTKDELQRAKHGGEMYAVLKECKVYFCNRTGNWEAQLYTLLSKTIAKAEGRG